ncbi:nitroreductase / dihydropteridine reductase [uncultured bacterium]|nr:nitroreductase / dihydropteridine reductase [uncultured bacterium]
MDGKLKNFYDLYWRRKSVREFSERLVEPEKIDRLLESLRRAQSAANRQPWQFVVVVDKDERAAMADVFTKEGFKKAPLLIVACADPSQAWTRRADKVNYAWVDVTIAVTEMIGAATAEGLGSCWVAAVEPGLVKGKLGIPEHIEIVAVIAVGYPEKELVTEDKARKPLAEIIHYGKW